VKEEKKERGKVFFIKWRKGRLGETQGFCDRIAASAHEKGRISVAGGKALYYCRIDSFNFV